jgi:TatD DNase family protein
MPQFVDTHCHLDAWDTDAQAIEVSRRARAAGVAHCVIPSVEAGNFDRVRQLAHLTGNSYCLGIHPLYVPQATDQDLGRLAQQLAEHHSDPRLVAVGEIGLDFFVTALTTPAMRERQEHFYVEQLRLARKFNLPVVLHVRRSADRLLKYLRQVGSNRDGNGYAWHGIAHAFNGSEVQARAFVELGLRLGFGGAVTFERALQLRQLARSLPLDALVLETDAPDIPPHWLYATADQRARGMAQGRNEPEQLPRIAADIEQLRGISADDLAIATTNNAFAALPRLAALLV